MVEYKIMTAGSSFFVTEKKINLVDVKDQENMKRQLKHTLL